MWKEESAYVLALGPASTPLRFLLVAALSALPAPNKLPRAVQVFSGHTQRCSRLTPGAGVVV